MDFEAARATAGGSLRADLYALMGRMDAVCIELDHLEFLSDPT